MEPWHKSKKFLAFVWLSLVLIATMGFSAAGVDVGEGTIFALASGFVTAGTAFVTVQGLQDREREKARKPDA